MHGHAQLKRFANSRGLNTDANATPESCIQQHYVDCRVQNICRELFEVYDNCVGGKRHTDLFSDPPHSVHAKHRIFQIIISDIFDLLSKPDRGFSRPNTIRIKTETIAIERSSKCTVTLEFVLSRKHASF